MLLVLILITLLSTTSFGLRLVIYNSTIAPRSLVTTAMNTLYGTNAIIQVQTTNTANITELSINGVVVANTITPGGETNFTFNAFGPISAQDTNAVVAGTVYSINGISTNSINLVALGQPANAIGNVIEGTMMVHKAAILMGIETPGGQYAYITMYRTANVLVIYTTNNMVAASVPVGVNPVGAAISPNGQSLYVANYGSNTISVINTANNVVTATVPVGINPDAVAVSPNNQYVYVANHGSNNISVIATANNLVTGTIPVCSPTSMAFTPDGKYVYVGTAYVCDIIDLINTITQTVTSSVGRIQDSSGAVTDPNGKYAQFSSPYFPYYGYNGNTSAGIGNFAFFVPTPSTAGGIAVSPNGQYLYITFPADPPKILAVNLSSYAIINTIIPPEPYPASVAFTPNGKHAYITYWQSPSATFSVINTTSNNAITTAADGISNQFTYSLNGGVVVNPDYSYNGTTPSNVVISMFSIKNQLLGTGTFGVSVNGGAVTTTSFNTIYNYSITSPLPANYVFTENIPANPNYTAANTVLYFSVVRGFPNMNLPNFPTNFTYNGSVATVNSEISTFDNQLPANVFLNGNLIASFVSSNSFTVGPGAGTYAVVANTVGNGNYLPASTSNLLVIGKATPTITLPNFPSNFVYNGAAVTVNSEISTLNNQLTANVFLNSNLITSFTSSNTFNAGPAAGTYNVVANTLGNGNYLAVSISNTITITKAHPVFSLEFQDAANTIVLNTSNASSAITLAYGTPFNITTISNTLNDQMGAYLFVNNVLNATIASSNTLHIATMPSGTYTFTFNSPGNNNYTAFDPSIAVTVLAQPTTSNTTVASSSMSINDNVNNTGISSVPVAVVYVIGSGAGNVTLRQFYQNQLPASLALYDGETANLSFACSFTIGNQSYIFAKNIYGIGYYLAQCNKNYTEYGGSFTGVYTRINNTKSANSTNTSASVPHNATVNASKTNSTLNLSSSNSGRINFINANVVLYISTNSPISINSNILIAGTAEVIG